MQSSLPWRELEGGGGYEDIVGETICEYNGRKEPCLFKGTLIYAKICVKIGIV